MFTWTGFYMGMNFGHAWTGSDPIAVASANVFDVTAGGFGPGSAHGASGLVRARLDDYYFGGQAGYNWQFTEKFLAGLEANIQGAGVRGGGGLANVTAAPGGFAVTSATLRRSLEYFGTIRSRLGYAVTPTILVYATGGLAYGGVNVTSALAQSLTPSLLIADVAKGDLYENRVGWTIGGGGEMALGHNLSAKLEYLYYDLGSAFFANPLAFTDVTTGALQLINAMRVSARFNGHLLRMGFNYRFDWSIPPTSVSAATPLFASPEIAPAEQSAFADWRILALPYLWAINTNGSLIARNDAIGTDTTIIDAFTKSSSFPFAFMGRVELSNGPLSFYGDFAWARLRFAGSTLKLRSPVADIAIAVSAGGRLRQTLAIGEAGVAYELARWKFLGAPSSSTALDAYAGLRYGYLGLDLTMNALGVANSQLLDLEVVGARATARSGRIQWVDPVVGLQVRHEFAPGEEFRMRGDIGGFGAGSKFGWQFYGGYSRDFEFRGLKFTSLIGYRAVGIDYSTWANGRENGLNAIIHGPVTGVGMRF
ncbi:outer membrane beta-barrel protein [Methylocystis sp.]|uniref:outer membrane protein n=1 Tax=Methylocystis sp. TaxID=1911079 RepID=UPI0025E4C461|nr:outer membrane beta-barrel protein [Methylocystis sp.]